jgi:hypothetical protein
METELNLRHPAPIGGSLFLATPPDQRFLPQNASIALVAVTLCLIDRAYIDFGARVPRWYVPLCVISDLATALFLVAIYAT